MPEIAKVTPQAQLLLDYMTSGRLVFPLIALAHLGVGSLTRRIAELREAGHKVEGEWRQDNHGRRFKVYWIETPSASGGARAKAELIADAKRDLHEAGRK